MTFSHLLSRAQVVCPKKKKPPAEPTKPIEAEMVEQGSKAAADADDEADDDAPLLERAPPRR